MKQINEEALNAILSRLRAAMSDLLQEVRTRVREMAPQCMLNRLTRRHDPSDVTQDVLTAVQKSIHMFRGDASQFDGWLSTLVNRRAVDIAKKEGCQKRDFKKDESVGGAGGDAFVPIDTRPSPSSEASRRERNELVADWLDSLPEQDRELLRLRFIAEESLEEIADKMGLRKDTVRMRIKRLIDKHGPSFPGQA